MRLIKSLFVFGIIMLGACLQPLAEYTPEEREDSRLKRFSVEFSVGLRTFEGETIARLPNGNRLFLGDDLDRTYVRQEYQPELRFNYQLNSRFSVGVSIGYVEAQVRDPIVIVDRGIFSPFYTPAADSRINFEDLTEVECHAQGGIFAPFVQAPDCVLPPVTPLNLVFDGNERVIEPTVQGKIRQVPISLYGRVDLMTKTRWRPYISGGVGYAFQDYRDNNAGADFIASQNVTGPQIMCNASGDVTCYTATLPDGSTVDVIRDERLSGEGLGTVMSIMGDEAFQSWETTVDDSIIYLIEGGFDWEFTKKWDLTAKVKYTWFQREYRSTINGSSRPFTAVVPNENFDPLAVNHNSDTELDIIYAIPGNFKLDGWNFAMGLKYTFGRYSR